MTGSVDVSLFGLLDVRHRKDEESPPPVCTVKRASEGQLAFCSKSLYVRKVAPEHLVPFRANWNFVGPCLQNDKNIASHPVLISTHAPRERLVIRAWSGGLSEDDARGERTPQGVLQHQRMPSH